MDSVDLEPGFGLVVRPKTRDNRIMNRREVLDSWRDHLTRTADLLEKTLMLGKTEGRRTRGATEDEMVGWHHRLDGYEFPIVKGREAWRAAVHGVGRSWTQFSD